MPLNANRRQMLVDLVQEGIPVSREWLIKRGFSRHAIDNLVKSNQLELIAKGVYIRNRSKLTWQKIVYSLQFVLKHEVKVGGISALELQGYAHYITMTTSKQIYLFTNAKVPTWVHKALNEIQFIVHRNNEIVKPSGTEKDRDAILEYTSNVFVNTQRVQDTVEGIQVSIPEKAFMEMVLDIPGRFSFEHADQFMQGLTLVSPSKVQKLLELSTNVKVNRLFLWFAKRNQYPWVKYIEEDKIRLGSGKRVIEKDGILDKKYLITVPRSL